jgi:hypothetical protein
VDRGFTPPGTAGYWHLGFEAAGRLGESSLLADPFTGKRLDDGQSLFAWAGDTWGGGVTLAGALADVCASEGGTFHLAADGSPVFMDRHNRPRRTDPDGLIDGALAGLDSGRSRAMVANRVEVTAHPREVDSDVRVLWSSDKNIQLAPGIPRTIVCEYVDPAQKVAHPGAIGVIPPAPGVDFTATDRMDGTGNSAAGAIRIQADMGANSACLVLTSLWPLPEMIYMHTLQIRGNPVRDYQPVTAVAADESSLPIRGLLPLAVEMPLQDDAAVAADMAHGLLINRKDPHPWIVVSVEATVSEGRLTEALRRDVGDRLSVTDPGLGLEGVGCFIESIRHEIGRGGMTHQVIWHTSPADLYRFWVLDRAGFAEIGQSTRLGY